MFLGGRWYRLKLMADFVPEKDPIGRLPITLATRNLIEPILGITDPRTDKRIDFVGGGRGLGELERRVNSGEMAVAFALYPTSMDDLMAVADAGASCHRSRPGSSPSSPTAWSAMCWIRFTPSRHRDEEHPANASAGPTAAGRR